MAHPVCREGLATVFTHDFTNRTHRAVFGPYNPEDLGEGSWSAGSLPCTPAPTSTATRTCAAVRVLHRLDAQRYEVDPANRARLRPHVAKGHAALAAFLRAACDVHGSRGCRRPGWPAGNLNGPVALRGPLPTARFRTGDMRFIVMMLP